MRVIDPKTRVLPPPGVYHGVPEVHYHGWKGAASSSELRILADESPAHVIAARVAESGPGDRQIAKVDGKRFGNIMHDLVLRPEVFSQLYRARPAGNANSNAFKNACAKILSENPFCFIVPPAALDRAHKAEEALKNHDLAGPAFFDTKTEVSVVWQEQVEITLEGGVVEEVTVDAKARLDAVHASVGYADLKMTTDISEDAVARKVDDYRYDLQAAWYMRGGSRREIEAPPEFAFFFMEDDEPFDIRMFQVPGRVLVAAEERLNDLFPLWARCQRTGEWPKSPPRSSDLPLTRRLQIEVDHLAPYQGDA